MRRLITICLSTLLALQSILPLSAAPPEQSVEEELARSQIATLTLVEPAIAETFTSGDNWQLGEVDGGDRFLVTGQLHVSSDSEQTTNYSYSSWQTADFYLEVDVFNGPGDVYGLNGVSFRANSTSYYFFGVDTDGAYLFGYFDGEEWDLPVESTSSDAIFTGPGATNRLALLAQGSSISLFANDVYLTTVDDDRLDIGYVGLASGAYDEGGVETIFDDLRLWSNEVTFDEPERPEIELNTPDDDEDNGSGDDNAPDVSLVTLDDLEVIRSQEPFFADDFDGLGNNGRDNWQFDAELTGDDTRAYRVRRGEYRLEIDEPTGFIWSTALASLEQPAADFLIEAEMQVIDGANVTNGGFFFRRDEDAGDGYYYFGVAQESGQYGLWAILPPAELGEPETAQGDEPAEVTYDTVAGWLTSDSLNTGSGATNHIALLVQGDRFTPVFNGIFAPAIYDDRFTSGSWGLAAGTGEAEVTAVGFDAVRFWDLDQPVDNQEGNDESGASDEDVFDNEDLANMAAGVDDPRDEVAALVDLPLTERNRLFGSLRAEGLSAIDYGDDGLVLEMDDGALYGMVFNRSDDFATDERVALQAVITPGTAAAGLAIEMTSGEWMAYVVTLAGEYKAVLIDPEAGSASTYLEPEYDDRLLDASAIGVLWTLQFNPQQVISISADDSALLLTNLPDPLTGRYALVTIADIPMGSATFRDFALFQAP